VDYKTEKVSTRIIMLPAGLARLKASTAGIAYAVKVEFSDGYIAETSILVKDTSLPTTTIKDTGSTSKVIKKFKVGTVKITGTAKVGKKLKVKFAKWSPKPKYTYQWYANGKKIKSATKATFKVTKKYKGKKISVKITAKKTGYKSVVKTVKLKKKIRK
jgi:hypothetical protein